MLMKTGLLSRELAGLFDGSHNIISLEGRGADLVKDLNAFCSGPTSKEVSPRARLLASTSRGAIARFTCK